jgi:hypothetical protein
LSFELVYGSSPEAWTTAGAEDRSRLHGGRN